MTELAPPNVQINENPVSPLLEMMDLNDDSNSNSNQSLPDQNTRTLKAVDEMLVRAKVSTDELKSTAQSIYLSKNVASDEFKLMEIDADKLSYLLEGNELVIRGGELDNAVCCTGNSTFSLKIAEISNPLLLTPKLIFPDKMSGPETPRTLVKSEVAFMSNCYFVLEKEKPKFQKLKGMLETNLYLGPAMDRNNDAKKYTIENLFDTIQASEEEIYDYLNYIDAYQIDGYWRLLGRGYQNDMIDLVLRIIDEKSWRLHEIPVHEIYEELGSIIPLAILKQFVNYYFKRNLENNKIYELNLNKIVRFHAEELLQSAGKMRFSTEFVPLLKRTIPSFLKYEFDFKVIQDLCYVEEPFVYYLNVQELPDNLEKRFKFLFDKRKKWSNDELHPFISDLCSNDNTEMNNALVKYCRPFVQNGVKFFTSRY